MRKARTHGRVDTGILDPFAREDDRSHGGEVRALVGESYDCRAALACECRGPRQLGPTATVRDENNDIARFRHAGKLEDVGRVGQGGAGRAEAKEFLAGIGGDMAGRAEPGERDLAGCRHGGYCIVDRQR